jgi:cytochrome b involved in lipid metabolism
MNRDKGERPDVGTLTGDDVAKHNSRESCWVIVHGKAYDVTEFLPGTYPPHSALCTMLLSLQFN